MDEAIQVSCNIDKLLPSWKDFKHTLKHKKEQLTLVELGSHMRIKESLAVQDSDKLKGNNVFGPLVVNMVKHNNSNRYNYNKSKRKHQVTNTDPHKKSKLTFWKCGKPGHLKKDCKGGKVGNKANDLSTNDDDVAWWVDLGATVYACKDRCYFKTYESLNDRSFLHMGNESTTVVHGCGCVDLRFSSEKIISLLNIVNDDTDLAFMLTSKLNDPILWHARLGHVHFKRMQDMSKDGLILTFNMDTEKCKACMMTKITKKPFQNVKPETKVLKLVYSDLCDLHATPSLENKKYFVTFIDDASRFCYVYLLNTKDEALDKFKVFKPEVELQQRSLIKRFRTDRGGEYMDTLYFQSVGIIHETTAPNTPTTKWVPNKRNKITPYEGWAKKKSNLNYLKVWGCKAIVRLPDPNLKTLVKRGIGCIFVGYAEHSKAFRFYVIEPNKSVSINPIIKSRDVIFDENKFSSVPRQSHKSMINGTGDIGGLVVLEEVTEEVVVQQPKPELRKGKRNRDLKKFGPEFQLYLIKGTRDEVSDQHSYCFNVEDEPKIFDEAIKSHDVAF
ncbi:zinc finger, CCHC-type containing protein [Tanacetum coccineum]